MQSPCILLDLGEKEKVKALVAEYVGVGKVLPQQRITFGYWLVRIDPPAALSIARELSASDPATADLLLRNVAFSLAADNTVEAERVLRLVPQHEGQIWMAPAIAWKMAMSDPGRARRLVDEISALLRFPARLPLSGLWAEGTQPGGRG